jgi:cytochrome P450
MIHRISLPGLRASRSIPAPSDGIPTTPHFLRIPYPTYARLRDESPLYYNEQYDFYAVSRYEDVRRGLLDRDTFISGRGAILEFIKANAPVPSGVFIFEDPPLHTVHRGLLNRVFTPKKMTALEPLIRQYCAKALDPLVEGGRFDFVADLGAQMPMRVIGMLLGIPEEDQQAVRRRADSALITEAGKPMDFSEHSFVGEGFEEYLDWRAQHPSDDLMTELVNAEFADETGTTRRLSRDEVLIFVNIIASAGNETTNRLIGWTGKVLAEHPDQLRQIL